VFDYFWGFTAVINSNGKMAQHAKLINQKSIMYQQPSKKKKATLNLRKGVFHDNLPEKSSFREWP